jgi:hypothetical protein
MESYCGEIQVCLQIFWMQWEELELLWVVGSETSVETYLKN